MVAITGLYAALMAVLFVAFSFYVSAVRGKTGVNLGDGGNATMLVAIRRHGNMAESTPFAVLLMAIGELQGLGGTWLHLSGLLLLAGRLVHPFGIAEDGGSLAARIAGQLATYGAMLVPAGFVLWTALA